MKLYATTTSERATKGQGGNNYLYIEIMNSKKFKIGTIAILPTNNINGFEVDYSFGYGIKKIADGIARVEQLKGKSQKGEKCASGHLQDNDGRCKCTNKDAY